MYETESISDNVNNELVSHSARLVSNKTKLQ